MPTKEAVTEAAAPSSSSPVFPLSLPPDRRDDCCCGPPTASSSSWCFALLCLSSSVVVVTAWRGVASKVVGNELFLCCDLFYYANKKTQARQRRSANVVCVGPNGSILLWRIEDGRDERNQVDVIDVDIVY